MKKQTLGIIGGVGPLATMFIGEMIVRRTKAQKDQEHLHTIIDNDTNIPDRTAFILDNTKENPVPVIIEDAKKLASVGADMIAIPCNTAHTFYDEIQEGSPIPVLHMIRETAKRASELGAERVGILATTGTLTSHMYQDALEEYGITPVVPDNEMRAHVMSIIYDYVKAGKNVTQDDWQPIEDAMLALNCDRLVLGCTELSIVNRDLKLSNIYIDSLIVLAERAILACGYELID
ncbi:amino acid racemase [Lysinibacillus fusiformis]|uniref:aspartate/glutamate racemase family protein n=1 Tax=Lysinibacillus TaxID=400634 RepID=UPI0004D59A22|nr:MULTISPECIES: amino acid racemase [Lysinibacillus]KAB0445159.1 aspartate racemase [Lysinibacillus fusiformis]KEK10353.1 aspartate racemase [Lysinibacillus sphaericus]KGA80247.1 aspartate racemase [Lysinibacillus fusiformis]MCE4046387.1 amino acid racemase [Lysinibacillus fusiformis]MCT6816177.1 amino acid racemase [Lysinibacillus fusiformis]